MFQNLRICGFQQAEINFSLSPWKERLQLHKGDFSVFESTQKFDLIVSNPPYFSNSSLSTDASRNIARHNITLSLEKLIERAMQLLQPLGKLCFIYPFENLEEVKSSNQKMHLSIKRLTLVKPNASKSPKRILVEITKESSDKPLENELMIEERPNKFSQEYITLTKDFYLKF